MLDDIAQDLDFLHTRVNTDTICLSRSSIYWLKDSSRYFLLDWSEAQQRYCTLDDATAQERSHLGLSKITTTTATRLVVHDSSGKEYKIALELSKLADDEIAGLQHQSFEDGVSCCHITSGVLCCWLTCWLSCVEHDNYCMSFLGKRQMPTSTKAH